MKAKRMVAVLDSLTPTSMPMTRDCVADIREIITRAQRSVVRHVNTTMTLAYWLVGRRIVVEEQQGKRRATYGEHLPERISRELTADFIHWTAGDTYLIYPGPRLSTRYEMLRDGFEICEKIRILRTEGRTTPELEKLLDPATYGKPQSFYAERTAAVTAAVDAIE